MVIGVSWPLSGILKLLGEIDIWVSEYGAFLASEFGLVKWRHCQLLFMKSRHKKILPYIFFFFVTDMETIIARVT